MRVYATCVTRTSSFLWLLAAVLAVSACSPSTDDAATTTSQVDSTPSTLTQAGTGSPSSTTTTSSPSSTTTTPGASSTTSTTTTTRATTTTASTTTTTIPAGNEPPTVTITAPAALSAHTAAYDTGQQDFGAYLTMSATAEDPNGDPFEIRWTANTEGFLGTGESITAWLSTRGSDATQPVITATAVDQWGTSTSDSIQIIVWIPSDT